MMFMKKPWPLKITANNSGKIAEFLCRWYMRFLGYKIIAKDYRCGRGKNTPYGELDFIAAKHKILVFCEVKKRKNDKAFLFALSYKQQQRIMNGAQYFIRKNPQYSTFSIRFDVFFVHLPFHVKHIKNALHRDFTV